MSSRESEHVGRQTPWSRVLSYIVLSHNTWAFYQPVLSSRDGGVGREFAMSTSENSQ